MKDPLTTTVVDEGGKVLEVQNKEFSSFFKSFYMDGSIIGKTTNFTRFGQEPTMFTKTDLFTIQIDLNVMAGGKIEVV